MPLHLNRFESIPEARVLPSTGITRLRQYYDPLRLPPGLSARRVSPDYPDHPSDVPCPLPRWIETGASVGASPSRASLPRIAGGSASTCRLSRPARASRMLRPVGSLSGLRRLCRKAPVRRLPGQTACQLRDQPTLISVEPTSTGVPRLRGALQYGSRNCSLRSWLTTKLGAAGKLKAA